MEIIRFKRSDEVTIGRLLHEGLSFYTVERPWLDNKAFVSCIPDGSYKVKRFDSPKFGKAMWQITEVPNRTFIIIHLANYSHDLQGCIGLGLGVFGDLSGVTSSKRAISQFYEATKELTEMDLIIRTGIAHV
jgi:hypothetical protein